MVTVLPRAFAGGAGAAALLLSLLSCVGALMLAMVPPVHADNRLVPPLPTEWVSPIERDHPLAGKVWSAKAGGIVDAQEMGRAIALARFTLLGEIHDNADHHLWQAWAIRTISKLRGSRIVEGAPQIDVIAMEMLSVDQYAGIDKFYGRDVAVPRPRPASAFGRMVGWDKSGWPDFKIYEPIIEQALFEQIVVIPASPSKELGRLVSKDGEGALSPEERTRLGLAEDLAPDLDAALATDIRDGHCGMLPEAALPRIGYVQRFRDATMADALMSVPEYKGGILIAGNGHVRRDRGVPLYLERRGVAAGKIVVVAHVEVAAGETDPATYVPRTPSGDPAVDFVVFTPRSERPDMCEEMRRAMERKKSAPPPAGSGG